MGAGKSAALIPWVDNARVLAVVGVLSFHFFLFYYPQATSLHALLYPTFRIPWVPFQIGWEADMLFFAISGLGLALSASRGNIGWLPFLIKRARRIYIPYWTALVCLLAYQGVCVSIGSWDRALAIPETTVDWICNLLLIQKFPLNLFSSHYWFLCSLVILYVTFPAVYTIIRRFRLSGFVVIFLLSWALRWVPFPFQALSLIFSAFTWAPEFVFGVYVGFMLSEDRDRTEGALRRALPFGIITFVLGTMGTVDHHLTWLCHPALGFGTLVIAYGIGSRMPHARKLSEISFEVYLVHFSFVGWYRHIWGFVDHPKALFYVFYLLTVTALGWIVHWLAERISDRASAPSVKRATPGPVVS